LLEQRLDDGKYFCYLMTVQTVKGGISKSSEAKLRNTRLRRLYK